MQGRRGRDLPPSSHVVANNEPWLPPVQGRSCSCSASGRASAPSSSSGFTRSRPSPSPSGPPSSCGRCLHEFASEWRILVYCVSALYRAATDKISSWILFLERELRRLTATEHLSGWKGLQFFLKKNRNCVQASFEMER
jgi:hypothetical protein